jgi:BirA family biotin operon repressor/biotin-[acetyl-CoA-carboxylase] ligase
LGAVSIAQAIREIIGLETEIKWPNDILIKDRKVAGILTEASAVANKINFVLLGVGINVNIDTSMFPEDLLMPATSLSVESGEEIKLPLLLQSCLEYLQSYYAWLKTDFEKILDEWRKLSAILGRQVRVSTLGETLEGIAADVDEQGSLILKIPSGELKTVRTGDLFIL